MNVKINLRKVLVGSSVAAMLFSVPVISFAANVKDDSHFSTISQDVLKEAQKNPIPTDESSTKNVVDVSGFTIISQDVLKKAQKNPIALDKSSTKNVEDVSGFTVISQDVLKEAQKNLISIDKNTTNLEDTSGFTTKK